MLRFLIGIFLVQSATVALVLLSPDLQGVGWLRLAVPIIIIGFFSAFWFQSLAKYKSKSEVENLKGQHLKEKAKIQLNAERAKTRLVKQTQKQIAREAKVTHAKANFKVGAAFAATIGAGALMLIVELFTFGLLTLSTAGGALGGYVLRARRESGLLAKSESKVIMIESTTGSKEKSLK